MQGDGGQLAEFWEWVSMSKNFLTIEQLNIACQHVCEPIEAGMTENTAIQSLELFSDNYAKGRVLGNVNPPITPNSIFALVESYP
jgi:hypothetical protein